MWVPLPRKAAALPFIRPLISAVMTGFSAVPVMLMGIPMAVEGLAAADELFNFCEDIYADSIEAFSVRDGGDPSGS